MRPGNPLNIRGWRDLLKPQARVALADPLGRDGDRLDVLSAVIAIVAARQHNAPAKDYVRRLLSRADVSRDDGDAVDRFSSGDANVVVTTENRLIAARDRGVALQIVHPPTPDADRRRRRGRGSSAQPGRRPGADRRACTTPDRRRRSRGPGCGRCSSATRRRTDFPPSGGGILRPSSVSRHWSTARTSDRAVSWPGHGARPCAGALMAATIQVPTRPAAARVRPRVSWWSIVPTLALAGLVATGAAIVLICAQRPSDLVPPSLRGGMPEWLAGPLHGLLPELSRIARHQRRDVLAAHRGDVRAVGRRAADVGQPAAARRRRSASSPCTSSCGWHRRCR